MTKSILWETTKSNWRKTDFFDEIDDEKSNERKLLTTNEKSLTKTNHWKKQIVEKDKLLKKTNYWRRQIVDFDFDFDFDEDWW